MSARRRVRLSDPRVAFWGWPACQYRRLVRNVVPWLQRLWAGQLPVRCEPLSNHPRWRSGRKRSAWADLAAATDRLVVLFQAADSVLGEPPTPPILPAGGLRCSSGMYEQTEPRASA